MDLKGSKTAQNLLTAFAGESQARNKYTYYASQAKKEGYNKIADFFEETANNEMAHAKIWFKLLHNGIQSTEENLKDASDGEHYEWTEMYYQFAKEAQNVFGDIIFNFSGNKVGVVEYSENKSVWNISKDLRIALYIGTDGSSYLSDDDGLPWFSLEYDDSAWTPDLTLPDNFGNPNNDCDKCQRFYRKDFNVPKLNFNTLTLRVDRDRFMP